MKKIISVLLTFILIGLVFFGCGNKNAEVEETTVKRFAETETENGFVSIETKYCTIKYPDKYGDNLHIIIDDSGIYTVDFLYGEVFVFRIIFGAGNPFSLLGTLTADGEKITVGFLPYSYENEDVNFETYRAMQDDTEVIVENLAKDYDFEVYKDTAGNDDVFEISFSDVKIYYPSRWKGIITVVTDEKTARFSYYGLKLFDIVTEVSDGVVPIGDYKGRSLFLVDYETDRNSVPTDDRRIISAMKDDINVIIDYLREGK